MTRPTKDTLTLEMLAKLGARCDCGGPQYGTAHAPDCALELAWDEASEIAEDILYQRESEGVPS